mgnify:CR=1 FL=1
MPHPRKPTKLAELSGAFKKNPQRRRNRAHEPAVDQPLGARPPLLPPTEAACWDEIVAQAPSGVLTKADRVIVECAARLLAKIRGTDATAADFTQLKGCMQQLGMTPASRSHVSAAGQQEGNEFAAA